MRHDNRGQFADLVSRLQDLCGEVVSCLEGEVRRDEANQLVREELDRERRALDEEWEKVERLKSEIVRSLQPSGFSRSKGHSDSGKGHGASYSYNSQPLPEQLPLHPQPHEARTPQAQRPRKHAAGPPVAHHSVVAHSAPSSYHSDAADVPTPRNRRTSFGTTARFSPAAGRPPPQQQPQQGGAGLPLDPDSVSPQSSPSPPAAVTIRVWNGSSRACLGSRMAVDVVPSTTLANISRTAAAQLSMHPRSRIYYPDGAPVSSPEDLLYASRHKQQDYLILPPSTHYSEDLIPTKLLELLLRDGVTW
eukprot:gene12908-19904_t